MSECEASGVSVSCNITDAICIEQNMGYGEVVHTDDPERTGQIDIYASRFKTRESTVAQARKPTEVSRGDKTSISIVSRCYKSQGTTGDKQGTLSTTGQKASEQWHINHSLAREYRRPSNLAVKS